MYTMLFALLKNSYVQGMCSDGIISLLEYILIMFHTK